MRRRRSLVEASVEVTPLIDVVFLLLIFFAVSTTFIRENQLGIELPKADGEPASSVGEALTVSVYRDGTYRVNDTLLTETSADDLVGVLVELTKQLDVKEVRLTITADALSTHQSVVRVLEAAGQAGLTRVSIVTRQPDDD